MSKPQKRNFVLGLSAVTRPGVWNRSQGPNFGLDFYLEAKISDFVWVLAIV